MLNGQLDKIPASVQMSVQNEPIIPVQVKYVNAQSAKILKNPRAILKISKTREGQESESLLNNNLCQSPPSPEELAHTSFTPPMSPTAGHPVNTAAPNKFQFDPNLSYAEKVAHEMIITEKIYLDNLKQIIDGFLGPVSNHPNLDISQKNIDDLFINVEEIYNFNWILLKNMEECNYDPVKLAECFVVKQTGFDVYTRYCTHYPRSMEVLMEWNQREDTASFIKRQQDTLGHTLPLCSFLLKPVQRILKYHLLLGNIAKHFKQSEDEEGFQVIQKALSTMTNVAKHINNMKRKHEDAVHLQEIQSVLVEYEGPNLTTFGSLVLEDTFRLHGTKTDRYLFLFKKALLITKRRSDGTFTWKATVMHSNMMLADSVFREPLTFQVFPFDDRKTFYTFVARNMDTKQTWLLELKRRLLDSYTAAVPMKAKQIILGNSREEYEKENAEPESDRKLLSDNTRKGANQQRTQPAKDDGIQSNKSNKGIENDRRKGKEFEENTEEKSRGSIDSIKSPLRRKLRVFKKRKFSKDQGKSPKRVSWSSDDNNEEAFVRNKPPGLNDELKKDNVTISNTQIRPTSTTKSDSILPVNIQEEDIEEDVSVESLSHAGKATMPVSGEVNNSPEHLKLRWTIPREGLPIKKRRLVKENREKSKSMPVGGLPSDEGEIRFQSRSQSMSQLHEQFTEEEMFSNLVSAKQLQNKYGLVNLRENASTIRTRRLGSFEEQMASIEGCLLVDSEANSFTDDAMCKIADDTKVKQTMKCVSAAFSDISPNFSPEKSPASSTEELTEDLTALDDDSDDFGMFEEEQATYGDIDDPPLTEQEMENGTDSKPECDSRQNDEEGDTIWDQIARDSASPAASNEDEALYSNGQHSNDDKSSTLLSARSSYTDNLSDQFCDDQDEDTQSLTNSVKGTYKKVFSLKRAYSEENLVSKCSLNEKDSNHSPASAITSKSCTNFEQKHFPIMRSKSIGSSSSYRSPNSRPFKFSVTPKKKIVIKDSLWETIKEDPENHERSTLIKDGLTVHRRRKRRTSQKSNNDCLRVHSTAQPQQKLYTYVSLHIADYRKANSEPKVVDHAPDVLLISESQQKYENGVDTAIPQAPRDIQLGLRREITGKSVTKVDVALKRKSNKPTREKSIVLRVDGNVSEAPPNINYLCVEKFPTDEHVISDELQNQVPEDSAKLNGASKVEKLSKYFSEFKPADIKSKSKSSKALRNANNVKKLIEELKGKEHGTERAPVIIPKERSIGREELNAQRISYRIDELQRVAQVEKQSSSDTKSELDNTVIDNAHNVERLKNRIEENSLGDGPCQEEYEVELGNQLQSRLCIKDHVDEIEHQDVNENTGNSKSRGKVDEELRTCQHIKDRIERLQKGKEKEVDHGKDITISDENEMTQCLMSPRQNEELKTVVIKRGWVQQFVQKIETGS